MIAREKHFIRLGFGARITRTADRGNEGSGRQGFIPAARSLAFFLLGTDGAGFLRDLIEQEQGVIRTLYRTGSPAPATESAMTKGNPPKMNNIFSSVGPTPSVKKMRTHDSLKYRIEANPVLDIFLPDCESSPTCPPQGCMLVLKVPVCISET